MKEITVKVCGRKQTFTKKELNDILGIYFNEMAQMRHERDFYRGKGIGHNPAPILSRHYKNNPTKKELKEITFNVRGKKKKLCKLDLEYILNLYYREIDNFREYQAKNEKKKCLKKVDFKKS